MGNWNTQNTYNKLNFIHNTCSFRARANNALTNFSLSPTYFEVTLAALILKKVMSQAVATPRARSVFPLPGGPNSSRPRAGVRRPVNNSGWRVGKITISRRACLAIYTFTYNFHTMNSGFISRIITKIIIISSTSWPAMSSHFTDGDSSSTSSIIRFTKDWSTPFSVPSFALSVDLLLIRFTALCVGDAFET